VLKVNTRVTEVRTLAEPGQPVQLKLEDSQEFELWHCDGFNLLHDTAVLVAMTEDEFNKIDRVLTEGPQMEGIKPPDTAKLLGSVYDFFWQRAAGGLVGATREAIAVQLTEIWARTNTMTLEGGDKDE